jgi:transposase
LPSWVATPAQITTTRKARSKPILDRLEQYLKHLQNSGHLPQSSLIKAVNYALNQWPALQTYLSDGRVSIDNNSTENTIRPTAVGKKNYPSCLRLRKSASLLLTAHAVRRWLFMGTSETGRTAAIYYTILETAKLHGLEPQQHLCDLLTALPTMLSEELDNWTPWAYAARHKPASAESNPQPVAA